jgi:surface antigen
MRYFSIITLFFLLMLSSCANKGQTVAAGGAAASAPTGQAVGHNIEATLVGAAAGGTLGNILGKEMDKYDREQLNHTYERGTSNQRTSWVNPDNGNQYTVTPQSAYQNPSTNRVCRRAEIEAVVNGKPQRTYSTACRSPSGSWELQQ